MRIPPKIFWAMSLVEWRAAIAGTRPRSSKPLARGEFEQLMQAFPDR
jgi:uncharacterized phage protein (TIGR02216 family)